MSESMDTTNFDDLLQQAEQLTAAIDGEYPMPRVERNLKQLVEAGQQLWLRNCATQQRDTSDIRASVLLGTKGYDLHKVTHQLDTLSSKTKKVAPGQIISETDIKGFLRNERENAIINIIDEVSQLVIQSTDRYFWDNLDKDWENEKMKILNSLVGHDDSQMEQSKLDMSVMSTTTPKSFLKMSFLETKNVSGMGFTETTYAKEVISYVEQIVRGGVYNNLVDNFAKIAKDQVGEHLIIEMWEMVSSLLNANFQSSLGQDLLSHRNSPAFLSALIKQSRMYLERKYRQSIEGTVFGQPKLANPTASAVYNLVKNYLNAKSPAWTLDTTVGHHLGAEDGSIEGHPVWVFVWHCLRAGSIDAAIEALQKSSLSTTINEFVSILREYKQSDERKLSPQSENHIRLQYKKSIRLSTDVYKRTVYSLLGCCGVNELQTDIFDKIDDYLWLRLGQVQLYDSDSRSPDGSGKSKLTDHLTMNKLQLQISEEYGESYFDALEQPLTYFKVLFLTGQWESAIDFLFKIDHYRCHAVHIGISLNEMGLLLTPQQIVKVPILSKDSSDPQHINRLNYSKLISFYTRKFEQTNSTEAIFYYYLLRNIRTSKGTNMFISQVSNLVRETKNFELLGYMNEEGNRVPGIIDKFQYDSLLIIDQVAYDCETNGFFEDAVKLYDLGSKHTKVLELLTKMLSPLVPEKKTPDSKRSRLEILAVKIAERYFVKFKHCLINFSFFIGIMLVVTMQFQMSPKHSSY